jgi:hypothetical protein
MIQKLPDFTVEDKTLLVWTLEFFLGREKPALVIFYFLGYVLLRSYLLFLHELFFFYVTLLYKCYHICQNYVFKLNFILFCFELF